MKRLLCHHVTDADLYHIRYSPICKYNNEKGQCGSATESTVTDLIWDMERGKVFPLGSATKVTDYHISANRRRPRIDAALE